EAESEALRVIPVPCQLGGSITLTSKTTFPNCGSRLTAAAPVTSRQNASIVCFCSLLSSEETLVSSLKLWANLRASRWEILTAAGPCNPPEAEIPTNTWGASALAGLSCAVMAAFQEDPSFFENMSATALRIASARG